MKLVFLTPMVCNLQAIKRVEHFNWNILVIMQKLFNVLKGLKGLKVLKVGKGAVALSVDVEPPQDVCGEIRMWIFTLGSHPSSSCSPTKDPSILEVFTISIAMLVFIMRIRPCRKFFLWACN